MSDSSGFVIKNSVLYEYYGDGGDVVIPDGVVSIDKSAFLQCEDLTSVAFPDSLVSIGSEAFEDCINLTSVTIPDSVREIGHDAFASCSNLMSVKIGAGVEEFDAGAFEDCSSLKRIWVDENNLHYSSNDFGFVFNKDKTELVWVPRVISKCIIPNSVKMIGRGAFSWCYSLTSVTIPDSVKIIGCKAFEGCSSLTSINIPYSVKGINHAAFRGCSSLTSIKIPDGVKIIEYSAFEDCSSLINVVVGKEVGTIDMNAFYKCSALTEVYFMGDAPALKLGAFENHNENLTLYYRECKSGWSTPEWNGLRTALWGGHMGELEDNKLKYLDHSEVKEVTLSEPQLESMSGILSSLRKLLSYLCKGDSWSLYEDGGYIYLLSGGKGYSINGDVISPVKMKTSAGELSKVLEFISKTIMLIMKLPFPVKCITFPVGDITSGTMVDSSSEVGSMELVLK